MKQNTLDQYLKSDWMHAHVIVVSSSRIMPNYEATVVDFSPKHNRVLVKGIGGSPLATPKWVDSDKCEVLAIYEAAHA